MIVEYLEYHAESSIGKTVQQQHAVQDKLDETERAAYKEHKGDYVSWKEGGGLGKNKFFGNRTPWRMCPVESGKCMHLKPVGRSGADNRRQNGSEKRKLEFQGGQLDEYQTLFQDYKHSVLVRLEVMIAGLIKATKKEKQKTLGGGGD